MLDLCLTETLFSGSSEQKESVIILGDYDQSYGKPQKVRYKEEATIVSQRR